MDPEKKHSIQKNVLLLLMVLLIGVLVYRYVEINNREYEIKSNKWDKLMLVLSQVEKHYVDSVDYKDVTEKILPIILERLDPHSVYFPPVELKNAEEELEGNFDGIGIQFNVINDTAIVASVIPGGPSEKVGIMSGDRIVKVNEEIIAGVKMDQDSMVSRMKGPSGSMVKIGVNRADVKEMIFFDIKRDKIPAHSVDIAYMVNDTIGYIRLIRFSRTTYKEVMEATLSLKNNGMKSLIFDLRDNSGGYFDQAMLLANEFLKEGELIVYMEGLHRKREDFYADKSGRLRDIKLAVIINGGSASSSEIFAGAIQDNDRGVIVGRRSFGKGLVQEPIYFSDKSGIRLTIARFYTPTGRNIQKPVDENYRYDIYERYRNGELLSADSIKTNDSLKFTTPGGRTVYGGGGIIPDLFVPLKTLNEFYAKARNYIPRFALDMAYNYRSELKGIKSMDELKKLLSSVDLDGKFLKYVASKNIVPVKDEWKESMPYIMNTVWALISRYSPLEERAYYVILNEIDDDVIAAITANGVLDRIGQGQ